MKIITFLIVIPIALLWSCQQDNHTKYTGKFQLLMIDFFDAVQTKNINKLKSLTTTDFVLYEHGKILNYDSMVNLIKGFPNLRAGHELGDFNVDNDDNIANMTYINHYIVYDSTQVTTDFLESAGFRNEQGYWKIRFIHSSERK